MKAAEVYRFKINKKKRFISQSPVGTGQLFWNSRDKGTYVRGIENKNILKRLNPFNKMRQE